MRTLSVLALGACLIAPSVTVQSAAAQSVEVTTLTAPDVFSGGAHDTGLGEDLWRDSSAQMLRRVLPTLGERPLTPAARGLAVRLFSTGANAPTGAGEDRALAAARGRTLLIFGDAAAANASVERIPNLAAEPALAEVAAETALITGDDNRACAIEAAVTEGRGEAYWLKLRAYCQAISGQPDAAQLSLTLANEKGRDKVFTRLMTALLLNGDPGEAAYHNGLELALSRRLNATADDAALEAATPAIHAVLTGRRAGDAPPPPPEMLASDPLGAARLFVRAGELDQARIIRQALIKDDMPGVQTLDLDLLDALIAAASGEAPGPVQDALVVRAVAGGRKSPAIPAALYLAALGAPMDGEARDAFAWFDAGKSGTPPARLAALQLAAERGRKGETALLVLSICADAGAAGPTPADRAVIIAALRKAGLEADARAFAVEGLLALTGK